MEALLVDEFGEADDPGLDYVGVAGVKLELVVVVAEEPDSDLLAEDVFGRLVEDLEFCVEIEVDGSEWLDVRCEWV